MSYRLCTSDISSKVLPHDDDYRVRHTEQRGGRRSSFGASDGENGNKIKNSTEKGADNDDLKIPGNESRRNVMVKHKV